tara:strand:- start:21944 stop:22528 length:585 start_codon:yes stop_codon:yes gene_type:complete
MVLLYFSGLRIAFPATKSNFQGMVVFANSKPFDGIHIRDNRTVSVLVPRVAISLAPSTCEVSRNRESLETLTRIQKGKGMSLTLYGLKNCDTCKKALKALEAAGKEVRFVDIRAEADLSEKVPYWLSAVGAKPLVNNRSTTWRGLSDAEKAKAETDEVSALLISNATLIKRPVIEAGDKVYVGWTKAVEAELTA